MFRICLTSAMLSVCPFQANAATLTFWHKEVGQKSFIADLCKGFEKSSGHKIKQDSMDVDQFKSALLKGALEKKLPDVALVPADFVGLHTQLKLSSFPKKVPESLFKEAYATTKVDGKFYGAPLLQGNHLMLYFNKKLVRTVAKTWDELSSQKTEMTEKGAGLLGSNVREMYWFAPVFGAFGGWPLKGKKITLDTPAMVDALSFYKSLLDKDILKLECTYDCAAKDFFAGKYAYAINGDWIYEEAANSLKADLGIALFPEIEGRKMVPMYSTQALVVPQKGLNLGSEVFYAWNFDFFRQTGMPHKEHLCGRICGSVFTLVAA